MKKIMIAAAIAAYCGAVSATGIESQNIVGYQTKSVRQFLSQQACTFGQIGVDGGALDIQKLIPVDGDGNYVGEGDINIQFFSDRGAFLSGFAYYGENEYDDDCPAGWYDEDSGELATYSFALGEAFQVSANSTCAFIYSGEVNMAETDIPFRKYLSFQANIRPTSVNIQTIIPVNGEGNYIGEGDINIQFFTNRGAFLSGFSYYGDDEFDDNCPAGWYDEDLGELAEYIFAAGEGFKLSANVAGYLRFPEL